MSHYTIHFQKGISLRAFLASYGTEDLCRHALFHFRWPQGFECPECGFTRYHRLTVRSLYQCTRCRHQTSLTAGTIFHGTKLKLTTWFLAMWLITKSKHSISTLELGRELGVSQHTAWYMKQKLLQVMKEREQGRKLSQVVQLDDAYMGGERHRKVKRGRKPKVGRGTKGKRPFLAAVEATPDDKPLYAVFQKMPNFRASSVLRYAQAHLNPTAEVVSDGLGSLRNVKRVAKRHTPIVTGGGWKSAQHPRFKWINILLGNLKSYIRGTTHAVRDKHLARYLAEFQWRFNRRFDLESILPRLIRVAAITPPFTQRMVRMPDPVW